MVRLVIEANSAEEVREVVRLLAASEAIMPSKAREDATPSTIEQFIASCSPNHRRMIEALLQEGGSLSQSALESQIGVDDGLAFGGTVASLNARGRRILGYPIITGTGTPRFKDSRGGWYRRYRLNDELLNGLKSREGSGGDPRTEADTS